MAAYFKIARRIARKGPLFHVEPGDPWLQAGPPAGKPVENWNSEEIAVCGPGEFPHNDYGNYA
jgi:hypothetical protein